MPRIQTWMCFLAIGLVVVVCTSIMCWCLLGHCPVNQHRRFGLSLLLLPPNVSSLIFSARLAVWRVIKKHARSRNNGLHGSLGLAQVVFEGLFICLSLCGYVSEIARRVWAEAEKKHHERDTVVARMGSHTTPFLSIRRPETGCRNLEFYYCNQ